MDIDKVLDFAVLSVLSPFEIKDVLAQSAAAGAVAYLNAGRGNPNWIATEPRETFFLLGQFAITESKRVLDLPPGVGGMPKKQGIADRLSAWLERHADLPGAEFLAALVPWSVEKFEFEPDAFVHELAALERAIRAVNRVEVSAQEHLLWRFGTIAHPQRLRLRSSARHAFGLHARQCGKVGLEQVKHGREAGEIVAAGILVRPADKPVTERRKSGGQGSGMIAESSKSGSAKIRRPRASEL